MESYEAIFIPVNDGKPNVAYSGTHWSLMVYIREVNSFFYYDTLKFNNLRDGEYASKRFQQLLQQKDSSKFIPSSTPQQENGSDCGGKPSSQISHGHTLIELVSTYYIHYRLYFTSTTQEQVSKRTRALQQDHDVENETTIHSKTSTRQHQWYAQETSRTFQM